MKEFPKPYKWTLTYARYLHDIYEIESEPINWQRMEVGTSRDAHDLSRDFSQDLTFIGSGAWLLETAFTDHGLNADVTCKIERRNDNLTYTTVGTYAVNFKAYSIDNGMVSINLTENNLRKTIDDRGGDEYEIPLENKYFLYDGVKRLRRNGFTLEEQTFTSQMHQDSGDHKVYY